MEFERLRITDFGSILRMPASPLQFHHALQHGHIHGGDHGSDSWKITVNSF